MEFAHNDQHIEQINDLITVMKAQGLITVISGMGVDQLETFAAADGFLFEEVSAFNAGKDKLGEETIYGLRGAGDDVLAAGADFIKVKADPTLLMKISAHEEAPLICASGKGITNDNVGSLALAGASFVDTGEYIFSHAKGVMQGAVNILHALDLAAEAQMVTQN